MYFMFQIPHDIHIEINDSAVVKLPHNESSDVGKMSPFIKCVSLIMDLVTA